MSTTVRVLSVTTALFAASTLYFAWAVGVERDRGAEFRASPGTGSVAADRRGTASANGATSAPVAEGSGGLSETTSAESPGLLDRLGALVGRKKRPSREQQAELFQKDFLRMFSDPATRKQLIEEQVPQLRDELIVLERRLDMPSDQWQRFLETAATHAIERRGASAVCPKDIQCQMRSLGPDAYARYDQELRDALGDANMEQYRTFNYALSERKSVDSLQAKLPAPQQLSEKAAEDLISALSEVRRAEEKGIEAENGSFVRYSGDGYAVVFPPNLKSLNERLEYAAGHFKKLQERAEALLNPAQLAVYKELHQEALRSIRRSMALNPALR